MDKTHKAYYEALVEYRDKQLEEYRELSRKLLVTPDGEKQLLLDLQTIASNRRIASIWAIRKFEKIVLGW